MDGAADFAYEIEALSKLLSCTGNQVVCADDPDVSRPSATPASIGPRDLLPVKVAPPTGARQDSNDIWSAEELSCSADDDADDGRETPEFEFRYKQSVTASDNFLGLSGKDPSSSCCEELVVLVQLPRASSAAEMELDITPQHLRLASATYKLSIHLPRKTNADRGRAKWHSNTKVLTITLPIVREDTF